MMRERERVTNNEVHLGDTYKGKPESNRVSHNEVQPIH